MLTRLHFVPQVATSLKVIAWFIFLIIAAVNGGFSLFLLFHNIVPVLYAMVLILGIVAVHKRSPRSVIAVGNFSAFPHENYLRAN
jgi:hypothetical protein